jgi:integrase/recombinase XerD
MVCLCLYAYTAFGSKILSENTRIAYSHDIDDFQTFTRKQLRDTTLADVQAYESTLSELADTTRSRKLAAIKSLLTFAHKSGYILVNVGSMVTLPHVRTRLAERILSREQVDDMIGKETDAYNHALLRLLYSTGIRVSEACDLKWRDVVARDNGKAQITVFGKGGKERAVLLSADTYRELQALRVEDSEQVFPNLYPRKAERIIERAAKRAGIDGNVSPHWMRHANASHALDRGAPIHVVQSTLGHASLSTTSKYTHARPSDSTGEYLGY